MHPGTLLEEILGTLDLPVSRAADELGVARQTLHRILAGTSAVTPEMAVRLGQFCGNGPELWLAMQQAFDLWHAKVALKDQIKKIPVHRAA